MPTKLAPNAPCPCGSDVKYKRCCRPIHAGRPAATPAALMRSRYSAYAGGLVDHVLATTDPAGPLAQPDRRAWAEEVRAFCRTTEFAGLEVLGSGRERAEGWVCFHALLRQDGQDVGFVENSRFVLRDGRWLYHSGEIEG